MLIFNVKNMNEKEKDELRELLLRMLAAQAYTQHRERYEAEHRIWKHGLIISYWRDETDPNEEYSKFMIKYEDGAIFAYRHIDEGTEGMEIIKIEK